MCIHINTEYWPEYSFKYSKEEKVLEIPFDTKLDLFAYLTSITKNVNIKLNESRANELLNILFYFLTQCQ